VSTSINSRAWSRLPGGPRLLAGRRRAAAAASIVSAVVALATFEAGLVTSFSGLCSRLGSSAGESACLTAATGALAGLFGLFGVLLVLPFTIGKPPAEPSRVARTERSE
jgi:preprotein translocase subunit SecG